MKKLLLAAVLVLAIAGMALGADGAPIKIGYLATLTGDGAVWGQAEQGGAMLAVREINKKGGLLGRPVELICYDTKGKPEDAINAVKRLIFEDKVAAIGGSNYSSIQLAIASVAESNKIPVVASAATKAVARRQERRMAKPRQLRRRA